MKQITMSMASAMEYNPPNPERTAYRTGGGMNFDYTFKEWPNRASMLKTIEMQSRRERHYLDWTDFMKMQAKRDARQALAKAEGKTE